MMHVLAFPPNDSLSSLVSLLSLIKVNKYALLPCTLSKLPMILHIKSKHSCITCMAHEQNAPQAL
jgi:hypothetical protein